MDNDTAANLSYLTGLVLGKLMAEGTTVLDLRHPEQGAAPGTVWVRTPSRWWQIAVTPLDRPPPGAGDG